MYLNILMTVVAVYVMLLPFLMFYFMTLIKVSDGNVVIETPKANKISKKKAEEVEKREKNQKILDFNIDAYDGTSTGQIPIKE